MSTLTELHPLPTTAETEGGPIVEHRLGEMFLRYDYEGETGTEWATIRFSLVVAYRFTPDASVSAVMVEAYSKLCEVEESEWRAELRRRASERGLDVPASSRHFVIYFDHYGCLEVLADEAAVEAKGSGRDN